MRRRGACVVICPNRAIQLRGGAARVDSARCTACLRCVCKCYTRAILPPDAAAAPAAKKGDSPMNPSSYTSTLLKAFDILDCFSSDSQEIGIKDISQKIDMPQSSVYRIIQSLEFAGMIYQNRENRKYRLGPKFIALSGRQSSLSGYMDIAMKYMKLLGHETSETVNLAMLDCDRVVYLHRVDSPHVLRPNFSLMERYSAVQTGLGLVLLADLNSAGLQWVYQNNADTLHIPYEEFTEQIAQIRRQGYAYDDQLFCEGLRCVAAPICGPGGKALFSISVSAPSLRMDDARYELVRQLVVRYSALATAEIQEL